MPLAEVDFAANEEREIRGRCSARAQATGRVDGVLVCFELDLSPTTSLSTSPARVRPDNHWACPVWLLSEPFEVRRGRLLELRYTHGVAGTHFSRRPGRGA